MRPKTPPVVLGSFDDPREFLKVVMASDAVDIGTRVRAAVKLLDLAASEEPWPEQEIVLGEGSAGLAWR